MLNAVINLRIFIGHDGRERGCFVYQEPRPNKAGGYSTVMLRHDAERIARQLAKQHNAIFEINGKLVVI